MARNTDVSFVNAMKIVDDLVKEIIVSCPLGSKLTIHSRMMWLASSLILYQFFT